MNEFELDQIELSILLKDSLGLSDVLSSRTYVLDKTLNKSVTVGWSSYKDRPDIKFVFSMGFPYIYLVASDGDPEKIGEVVAWVSDYNSTIKKLSYGDACVIENSYLKSHGYVGCFLAPPAISDFYGPLANKIRILGRDVFLSVLIFISGKDYEFQRNNGPKGFVDLLINSGKSIVKF